MTTYIRTEMGIAAILNNSSDLSRKLRTLLIAVDGRTDTASFERNLSSFGDVLALLETLKVGGYIEKSEPGASGLKSSFETPRILPPVAPMQQNSNEPRDIEAQRAHRNTSFAYQPAGGGRYARGNERSHLVSDELKVAVSLMSGFVTQHLPQNALEIVLELERLSSVEALMQSLGHYEQLIEGTGAAGQRHLLDVRAVLKPS